MCQLWDSGSTRFVTSFVRVPSTCTKGSQLYIEGPLQTRSWTDRDGAKRYVFGYVFCNIPTTDQVTMTNIPVEFLQRSHIAAFDLTYEVSTDWSIGGKVAYRMGQVSLDRVNREFFDNAAKLAVLRVDWRFLEGWESLAEARMLDLPDVDQRRIGALAAVYRYFGKHLKAGVGYNFTDFSDDLTDLSYDHQGAFVSLAGMNECSPAAGPEGLSDRPRGSVGGSRLKETPLFGRLPHLPSQRQFRCSRPGIPRCPQTLRTRTPSVNNTGITC
jgi:hypothetical protein